MKKIVLGVAGPIGSGKGTVVDYFVDKGFVSVSLSDEIRHELRKRHQEITRHTLQAVGNELREKLGDDVLAKRAWDRINAGEEGKVVIESIRHPFEAKYLKSQGNFHLIAVVVDQKTRYERVSKRARSGDTLTWEDFIKEDEEESKGAHGEHSQLVDETAKLADFMVDNSGSLEDTYEQLAKILQEVN